MTVKKLASIWLITLGFQVLVYGANVEKPISLQIENLTRWKNSSEAIAIRQGLNGILKPRKNYPQNIELLKEMRPYASIFKRPFLLLEAEPTGFGGFFALVTFKSHPKVLRLWIYEIDKNAFEIREAIPLRVTLNKIIMDELEDKRIVPFWIASSSL